MNWKDYYTQITGQQAPSSSISTTTSDSRKDTANKITLKDIYTFPETNNDQSNKKAITSVEKAGAIVGSTTEQKQKTGLDKNILASIYTGGNPYAAGVVQNGMNDTNYDQGLSLYSPAKEMEAPKTSDIREMLIAAAKGISDNSAYVTTVEQSDELEAQRKKTLDALHKEDEILGNNPRSYDARERAGNIFGGATDRTASSYVNLMGTGAGVGNSLNEASSIDDRKVASNDYAGWATDELTAGNIANSISYGEMESNEQRRREEEQRLYDIADSISYRSAEKTAAAKEGLGTAGKFGVDLTQQFIQLGIDAGGRLLGLGMLPFFARAAGGAMGEARQEGASSGQQLLYGFTVGGIEAATEKLSGSNKLFGKGVLDKAILGLSNKAKSPAVKSAVKILLGGIAEGGEEVLADILNPFAKLIYDNNALAETWEGRDEYKVQMLQNFLIGAAMGLVLEGASSGVTAILQNSQTNSVANAVESAEQQTENAEATQNAQKENTAALNIVGGLLSSGRINNTDATLISRNPEISKAFTEITGIELNGTLEQNRTIIQRSAREISLQRAKANSAVNESINALEQQSLSDSETERRINESQRYEQAVRSSGLDSYVRGIGIGGMSVSSAREVINNPSLRKTWENMTGIKLPESKNRAVEVLRKTDLRSFNIPAIESTQNAPQNAQESQGNVNTPPATQNAVTGNSRLFNTQDNNDAAQSQNVGANPDSAAADGYTSSQAGATNGLETGNAVQTQQKTDYQFRPGDTGETTRTVERGTSYNVRTNENTDPVIRQMLDDAPLVYQQISNKKTFNQAKKIFDNSFDDALATVEGHLVDARTQNKKLAVEDVPLSYMVANELAKRGEVDRAMNIISNLAAELTYYGQANQANIIMRNASPVTKAKAMQNLVNKINNDLTSAQKKKNVEKGLGTETGEIVIDNDLLQEYVNATDDTQRNAVIDKINQSIADQMPPTLVEQFNAMRYSNMLGNFKTIERNVTGNALFYVLTKAKNRNNVLLGKLVNAVKPGTVEKTGVLFVDKDLKKQAMADADNVIDRLKGNGKFRDNLNSTDYSAIQDKRKILPGPLEQYRKGTQWMLDNKYFGDVQFLKLTYSDALAGYVQARGYKDLESVPPDIMENARDYAINEAQEATFRDSNVVSDSFSRIGRSKGTPKALNIVSEGIMPFRRTPANILVRSLEYSPVGLGESVIKAFQTKSGKTTATDVVNSLSKSLTGSAIFAAGIYAGIKGFARTKDDDEELEKYRKMQGYQDYSVNIGGHSVSLSQLAPAAVPFFMGVELSKAWGDEKLDLEDLPYIASAISGPLLEMSMLNGINDTLSNLSDYNNSQTAIFRLFMNATMSYLTQGLTNSLIGQLEQASEEYRQTSYTDKDASFLGMKIPSWMQYSVSKAAAKIPGIDFQQQDYVDEFGRKQSNGSTGWRYLNALFNPFYSGEIKTTSLDSELERLHEVGKNVDGFPNVLPDKASRSTELSKGFTMSPDEYQQYSIDRGTMSEEYLNQLIQSPYYQNLSDEQKAETISKLYSVSADRASKSVLENNGIEYTGKMDNIAGLSDVPGYYAYYSIMQDAADKKPTTDWQSVMKMMQGFTSMPEDVKTELKGKSDMHLKAVEYATNNGLSPKDWYSTYDVIKDAKVKTGSEAQVVAAIAINGINKNLSDADKLMMLQSQLPLAKDGSIPTIVRRYDVAMNSYNISFDDWTKFETALKEADSTSKWTIRSCAQSVGINPDEAVKVYKTLYKDPKYTAQVNEEFLYLNPLDENGEVAPMSFTDYYNSFNEDQQQPQGTTTDYTLRLTPGMTEIDYQNLIRMSKG